MAEKLFDLLTSLPQCNAGVALEKVLYQMHWILIRDTFFFLGGKIHIRLNIGKITIQWHLIHSQWCAATTSISSKIFFTTPKGYPSATKQLLLILQPPRPCQLPIGLLSMDIPLPESSWKQNHILCGCGI